MLDLFVPSIKEKKIDSICFNIILFDIFFLPLFPLISVSISLPIMVYWYLSYKEKLRFFKEYRYYAIIIILMLVSTCMSIFGFEHSSYHTTFTTSIKRFLQYVTSFWYFYFFLYFFTSYRRNISNIVLWGIIVMTLYAVLYSLNQPLFFTIKQILCPFDPQVIRSDTVLIYRYNFLWADPNNVAYACTSLTLFYIIESRHSTVKKYLALICLLYVLMCTMSIGGIAVAAVTIGYVSFFSDKLREGKKGYIIGFVIIFILIAVISYYFDFIMELYDNGLGKRQEIYGDSGIEGGGGRIGDFLRGLRNFNPLFLFIGSGQEGFVTEIGHWYVIFLYGFPVYIYFIYILFGKRKNQKWIEYISIVPVFAGFTINTSIGEQKYLLITLLISAYYAAKSHHYYKLT